MKFKVVCETFEKLEKTTKRLEKILILRDFFLENKKEGPLIFDLIAGNYQREIDKKTLAISLKTIFSVIAFTSKESQAKIEKEFNKIGDVGTIALNFLSDNKQTSLNTKSLTITEITNALEKIANTSGTNKNKIKKEILTNLFLYSQSNLENKYLARQLIDDLRIGVSEGVLREAMVNSIFPPILGINLVCSKCQYTNLNLKKCLNCSTPLDSKNQEEYASKKFEIVQIGSPKEIIGLDNFLGKTDSEETLKFILRTNPKKYIIKTDKPRELYNLFLEMFEKKYNLINSFRETFEEINEELGQVINPQIILGKPIKSMLGVRAHSVNQAIETIPLPALADFKYDGLRVQIHNNKGKVSLFSRNLENITKQFPEVVEFIKHNFPNETFVLDTECVGFDFKKMQFLPFQLLSRRILTKNIDEVNHITVTSKAFDILYYNNETLIDKPYEIRREILEKIFLKKSLKQKINFDLNKIKQIK